MQNSDFVLKPVGEIGAALRKLDRTPSILLHTDAAQAVGKIPISVSALGVDYLTVVGHKVWLPVITKMIN